MAAHGGSPRVRAGGWDAVVSSMTDWNGGSAKDSCQGRSSLSARSSSHCGPSRSSKRTERGSSSSRRARMGSGPDPEAPSVADEGAGARSAGAAAAEGAGGGGGGARGFVNPRRRAASFSGTRVAWGDRERGLWVVGAVTTALGGRASSLERASSEGDSRAGAGSAGGATGARGAGGAAGDDAAPTAACRLRASRAFVSTACGTKQGCGHGGADRARGGRRRARASADAACGPHLRWPAR